MARMLMIITVLCISACATKPGFRSVEQVQLAPHEATIITHDLMAQLQEEYPPARSRILLSESGILGKTLESELRQKGYAVVALEDSNQPTVQGAWMRYAVNPFTFENTIWVMLESRDGYRIIRAYQRDDDKLMPRGVVTLQEARHE